MLYVQNYSIRYLTFHCLQLKVLSKNNSESEVIESNHYKHSFGEDTVCYCHQAPYQQLLSFPHSSPDVGPQPFIPYSTPESSRARLRAP